jgi:hypothetical protein
VNIGRKLSNSQKFSGTICICIGISLIVAFLLRSIFPIWVTCPAIMEKIGFDELIMTFEELMPK